MFFPHWEVPHLGGGMVIAIIATIHVLIAHFAVGAGLFLAYTEFRLKRRPDEVLKDFLGRYGKFLILFSFVAGAVTGVGIWFAIGLVSPRATSLLIHNYVWGWAAEWCLFFIEIAAGYCYYYGFDRLPAHRRRMLAYIYAATAWGSLFIINGILTFMLTPGEWLPLFERYQAGEAVSTEAMFWLGFFNPTYWPSLVLRTLSSLSLAGIFAAIVATASSAYSRTQAQRVINYAAWFLAPLVLMPLAAAWFFAMVPEDALRLVMGGAIAMVLFFAFGVVSSALIGLYAFVGLIWRRRYVSLETAVLLAAIAFIATGSMEFMREGIRKPYLVYGHLYSAGWAHGEELEINTNGILAANPWVRPEGMTLEQIAALDIDDPANHEKVMRVGSAVYDAQCAQCHVHDGFNDLKPIIHGWDEGMMSVKLADIHRFKAFMPPLVGTELERAALARFLVQLNEPRRDAETAGSGDAEISSAETPAREVPQ